MSRSKGKARRPHGQPLDREDAARLLGNWIRLNDDLPGLPIKAIVQLMEIELVSLARPSVLLRLHGRFNKLRAEKERVALMHGQRVKEIFDATW